MSHAPFLTRIEDSLLYVSSAVGRQDMLGLLEDVVLEVVVTDEQPEAADLMVSLASRLYPRIVITGDRAQVQKLETTAHEINPEIELGRGEGNTLSVAVGRPLSDGISIGVSGGVIGSSIASEADGHPVAQGAAACVVMGQAFARVFAKALPGPVGLPERWGLLPEELVEVRPAVDLSLIGAGALGQAFLWALRRSVSQGKIVVVDHEVVALSNLQRYVLSSMNDVDRPKVEVAHGFLQGAGIRCDPIARRWEDVFAEEGHCRVGLTVLALDSAADRVTVQAGLPRVIVNGWTQQTDVGVSVHDSFGAGPCVSCLYPPTRGAHPYERIAQALNLNAYKVLAYVESGTPISEPLDPNHVAAFAAPPAPKVIPSDIAAVSLLSDLAARVPEEVLIRWSGSTVSQLYSEGFCGGALLQYAADATAVGHVPLAHQSALGGMMMMASVLKQVAGVPQPTETRIDLLGPGVPFDPPVARRESCLCADEIYRDHFIEKWANTDGSEQRNKGATSLRG